MKWLEENPQLILANYMDINWTDFSCCVIMFFCLSGFPDYYWQRFCDQFQFSCSCYVRRTRSSYSQIFFKRPLTCDFIKKRLQHKCFPVNTAKFLRTTFLWKTFGGWFRRTVSLVSLLSSRYTTTPYEYRRKKRLKKFSLVLLLMILNFIYLW